MVRILQKVETEGETKWHLQLKEIGDRLRKLSEDVDRLQEKSNESTSAEEELSAHTIEMICSLKNYIIQIDEKVESDLETKQRKVP